MATNLDGAFLTLRASMRAIRASGLDLELATQRARAILEPARQTVPTDSGFYGQLIEVAGDDIHLITRILVSIRDQGAEYRKGSYWLEPVLRRTLGVPLFQEQLLRMAMAVAGLLWARSYSAFRFFRFVFVVLTIAISIASAGFCALRSATPPRTTRSRRS